ncbi:MGDG synthase family glycosyltransferase [Streptomyces sp. WM6378]|uniref:MGDG synthase family glycosyltransferase n=1 Tax=Streptomyces sp. WM6378 TaxID=1415557 RepID=UPI000ADE8381|nr:UDP-N-acetylglucosamine--N-acetylglucosamine transferase [Streptomyces sp. WM6378]
MPRRDIPDDVRPTHPPHGSPAGGRITIVSASVGAGHDGAADALALRLEAAGFAVDRHDFLDLLPFRLGRGLSDAYHRLLTSAPSGYQRIYAVTERSGSPGPAIRALLRSAERRTLRTIRPQTRAVVSTYPLAGQVLGALRRGGRLTVPAFTYLTDFSVHPLWVAPGIDAHLAAHPVPAAQAAALGAAGVRVTGPVTGPRFTAADEAERRGARDRFGLPHDAALALLVAGSWGVGPVRESAAEIRDSAAAEPVVVCGRNAALAEQLRADGFRYVHEWVGDMPLLMRACDVLVQNAGGLTSLEAFASGLPVASYRCIPGHGQTNAAALDEAGLAAWIREPQGLTSVLSDLVKGPLGERQRAAGLALFATAPGPAAVIADAALPRANPTAKPQLARHRGKLVASALTVTLSLGIGAPLAHAYENDRGRLPHLAHSFFERCEL